MIEKIELKQYWYFNSSLPTHMPKKVTVRHINGNVVMFDEYVASEKYADKRVVMGDLYNNREDARRGLALVLAEGSWNFIEDKDSDILENEYPEYFL